MTVNVTRQDVKNAVDLLKAAIDENVLAANGFGSTLSDTQSVVNSFDTAKTSTENAAAQAKALNDAAGDLATAAALDAINASIGRNPEAVCLYDTTKDSDGGAWRFRCGGKTWENETLDTATRGPRRDFPALALIVGGDDHLSIYDADDPDLTLWMRFDLSGGSSAALAARAYFTGGTSPQFRSIAMRNGKMAVALRHNDDFGRSGLFITDFIAETNVMISVGSSVSSWNVSPVALRNQNTDNSAYDGPMLFNRMVNMVDMTVVPDAPIDPATNLPVPTIAACSGDNAYEGGIDVFHADGSHQFIDRERSQDSVILDEQCNLFSGDCTYNARICAEKYLGNHVFGGGVVFGQNNVESVLTYVGSPTGKGQSVGGGVFNGPSHNTNGINTRECIQRTMYDGDLNPVAQLYQTASYVTGWMPGDIKGAWLADTVQDDLTDAELVTNGDFSNGATGWINNHGVNFSVSNGVASLSYDGSRNYGNIYQIIPTKKGRTYRIYFNKTKSGDFGSTRRITLDTTQSGNDRDTRLDIAGGPGEYVGDLIAPRDNAYLCIKLESGDQTSTDDMQFDLVSVVEVAADRTVNAKGLTPSGTITREPVAPGAELVGYRGTSNQFHKLTQPYNPELDFGPGDFTVCGWVKGTGTYYLFDRSASNGGSRCYLYCDSSYGVVRSDLFANGVTTVTDGEWHFWAGVKQDGVGYLYVDGKLESVNPYSGSIDGVNEPTLNIGHRYVNGQHADGVALFRISATATSAELIRRIYEDERRLFMPNAKCTFAGTSDAAYTTVVEDNLLHVWTMQQRSTFDGLVRVAESNSNTSFTAAANGMIVED